MATTPQTLSGPRRVSTDIAVFFTTFLMFSFSLLVVFYGFIGYYSRINLSNEFNKDAQNIDSVFALISQIKKDEIDLKKLRNEFEKASAAERTLLDAAHAAASASDEYKKYIAALSDLTNFLFRFKDELDKRYWSQVTSISIQSPDIRDTEFLLDLTFQPTSAELSPNLGDGRGQAAAV